MSGCEKPLVNDEENRKTQAARKADHRAVTESRCPADGGRGGGRRLRRVIRKLPILGATHRHDRLKPHTNTGLTAITIRPENRSGVRTPRL